MKTTKKKRAGIRYDLGYGNAFTMGSRTTIANALDDIDELLGVVRELRRELAGHMGKDCKPCGAADLLANTAALISEDA